MKKLSISMFALAIVFALGSAFTSPLFTGYKLFIFQDEDTNPSSTQREDAEWFEDFAVADDQQSEEYDLDQILDPSPLPNDEICTQSSEVCLAQIKIENDVVDLTYGVDFRTGTLVE